MLKAKKQNSTLHLSVAVLSVLLAAILGFWALNTVKASEHTDTVDVSATVDAFLQLSADGNIGLGALVSAAGVSTPKEDFVTLTSSSNSDTGYGIQIESANNGVLQRDGGGGSIEGSGATHTAEADVDGYGALCDGSGSAMDCLGDYSTTTSPDVVKLSSTPQDFASTSSQEDGDEIILTVRASSVTTNPTGTYEDTLTLTAVTSLP